MNLSILLRRQHLSSIINAKIDNTSFFDTIISINELNSGSIQQAKDIFESYKNAKIIVNSNFTDNRWQLCDEYANVGMVFHIPKFIYKRHYESILGLSIDECIEFIKTYIMLLMGKNVLITLRNILNDIKKILSKDIQQLYEQFIKLNNPSKTLEFFEVLPAINIEQKELLIDLLININEVDQLENYSNRRELANFLSYLKFDKYINDYWSCELPSDQRLFFYPVYLWWKITAIIPLRPREFLLTPRNCISMLEDKYYITLQRNTLKGSSGRVHYNISLDYTNVTYQIPKSLYDTIKMYINATDGYSDNIIDTLFRTETHYAYFDQNPRKNNRFYTYVNLSTCLKMFYRDILSEHYNLYILNKDSNMPKDSFDTSYIEFINLGDTRHIAMINLITEGGSPSIAMQLAGHSSIEMSSHYYANISNMIECKTYLKYKELITEKKDFMFGVNYNNPIKTNEYIDLGDGNKCYSNNFVDGNIIDCRKVVSDTGEIGNCYQCTFFRKNNMKYFLHDDAIYKSLIQKDCHYLYVILKKYRRGLGYVEDIKEALMKLLSSTTQYKNYYMKKLIMNHEEVIDGATEESSI